jgi:hypothetical protein
LSFRGTKQLFYALQSGDEKYGNRGAMVRCPFALEKYQSLSVASGIVTPLSESEAAENVDILYNLKPNPKLVQQILAARKQLN